MDRSKKKPPNRSIEVSHEYRRPLTQIELERLIGQWKERTGCQVKIVTAGKSHNAIKFEIFGGSASDLDKASQEINDWIHKSNTRAFASQRWAKLSAFDFNNWWYEQLAEWKTTEKQRFKGPLPQGDEGPHHKVTVPWSEKLANCTPPITPRDVFGNKLELLDPIRLSDEVYIVLSRTRDGGWPVEIMGYDMTRVEMAKQHYDNMVEKAANKHNNLMVPSNIVLDSREGDTVVLHEADEWWPDKSRFTPRLETLLMNDPGSFRQDPVHFTQFDNLHQVIRKALDMIRYEKSTYDFSVRFGCITLSEGRDLKPFGTENPGITWSTQNFIAALDKGKINCEVKKWVSKEGEEDGLLARLMSARHLLQPMTYKQPSLREIRPTFRGTWVFIDPNKDRLQPFSPSSHCVVVQIDWTEDEEGNYEKMPTRFFTLEQGKRIQKENMDVNLLELGVSKAWHFGLESMKPLRSKLVPPALVSFANQVKMIPGYDASSHDKDFAQWPSYPSLRLQISRLDKIYTFRIRKTSYNVEAIAMRYQTSSVTCWGLVVRHDEWASHLAELENLPPGGGASWKATMSLFFPEDGQDSISSNRDDTEAVNLETQAAPWGGLQLFVNKLMQLSEVTNSPEMLPEASPPPSPKRIAARSPWADDIVI
ncbi:hypothetical protein BS50DRAFT_169458 [Corynespora cassiicola Philippines]|uniref:DUF7905 domain-containing protein n=1 Tax=Corynespora cassiicola Philippines TaxID=1448308 RepID=A0A2T2P568_CORCC|nr:hypothetical protein BS50DRAFT_169458 [Corynespora cassiicola Philippines]